MDVDVDVDGVLGGGGVDEIGAVGCAVEVEVDVVVAFAGAVVVDEPPVFVPSPDSLLVMSVIAVA